MVMSMLYQGFVFDGASIPKFLRTFFSPVGVLLMGGLVHDYAYKYACLKRTGKGALLIVDQKEQTKSLEIYVLK